MACLISDIVVSGVDDGAGGAASVTVSGRAQDCASGRVLVKLFCGGAPVGARSGAIVVGAWTVTFDDPPCLCGNDVHVEAECEGTQGCRTVVDVVLACVPPEGGCPAVDGVDVDVGECADGLRRVTFTVMTNAVAASVAEIEFDDGDSDAFAIAAGIDTTEVAHTYAAGTYVPTLSFLLPEGCPPIELEPIDIPACCLGRDDVEITLSDCKDDGTRDVTFGFAALVAGSIDFGDGEQAGFAGLRQIHAYRPRDDAYRVVLTLEGCDPLEFTVEIDECPIGCLRADDVVVVVGEACDNERRRSVTFIFPREIQGEIDFDDGSPVVAIDGENVVHDYPARVSPSATYTATVSAAGNCPPVSVGVEIPACPCVTADQIQVVPAEDCDAQGHRSVGFTFPWEVTAEIDYGDGESEQFTAVTRTHVYAPREDAYAVLLTLQHCPPLGLDVVVPACDGGGGGEGGGADSDCGNLRYVVAGLLGLALAGALLLLALQVCLAVPVPWFVWLIPITLAAAAGVVIALWYAFCDPPTRCDWLFIAWAVPLVGGIVALYLSGCCGPLMIGLSIAFFLAAGIAFAAWLVDCRPSGCEILQALALAIATAAGGILGAIGTAAALVPALLACLLWWVAAAVGLLVAVLVPAALACRD